MPPNSKDPLSTQHPQTPYPSPLPLVQILEQPLPPCPEMKDKDTASSTRAPKHTDWNLKEPDRLCQVVYCSNLANQLIDPAIQSLKGAEIRPETFEHAAWLAHVHPAETSGLLTQVVNSEEDSREWIQQVLVRPSIALIRAARMHKTKLNLIGSTKSPFVVSAPGSKTETVPDGLLVDPDRVVPGDKAKLTFEYKTHNAMTADAFDRITRAYGNVAMAQTVPALKFWWPDQDSKRIGKATKFFVQVWTQMIKHDVQYAILTSYESTVFFYRPKEHDGTLYFSNVHKHDDDRTLCAVFAFMSYALGQLPNAEFYVPQPDSKWRSNGKRPNEGFAGVDETMLEDLKLSFASRSGTSPAGQAGAERNTSDSGAKLPATAGNAPTLRRSTRSGTTGTQRNPQASRP